MNRIIRAWTLGLLTVAAGIGAGAPAAFAQEVRADLAGAKDHPLFTRMSDFIIYSYEQKDFDTADFIVNGKTAGTFEKKSVEGKKTVIGYLNKAGTKPSAVQITRNYLNAAKRLGAITMFDGQGKDYGFEGGLYAMRELTLKFPKEGGEIWAGIAFDTSYGDPDLAFVLTIVETAEMKQEVTAADMLTALTALGRIALSISFDTGKATIQPASMATVGEIEKLLKQNASLRLYVDGHTDNTGAMAANQTLSEARAKAVVAELVGRGIAAARLEPRGFGQTKPVSDNTTDAGRAANRRVELVLIK